MRTPLRAALRLALAAWLGLAGMSALAAPCRAADPEKALPSTTFFFAKAKNVSQLRDAFWKTAYGQLLADPAMKDFEAEVLEKLDEASKVLKDKVGVTLKELLTLPEGTVSFAILAKEGKVPVAVLIQADAGKNADKMSEVMAKAMKVAQEEAKENAKVSTEKFKDLELHIVASGKENEPPLVWTRSGTVFHISSDIDALKDVISHADGRDDSLAKNESFLKIQKKIGDGPIVWFLDVSQVIKLGVKAAAANPNAGGPQPEAILQILGINGLKAIGGTVAVDSGGYDTLMKTFVLAPAPSQGLLKIFSMPKTNLKPEPWVPDTVASYQTISWDLDAAFTAINDLANNFQPGILNVIEQQLAGPNGGEGISFQKDLFGPLGDRITIITDFKKPIKEDSQRFLLGVALEDSKKFQATLNKVIALAMAEPKKREFQGTTIYDFTLPEMPAAPNSPFKGGVISLAIAKDYFFIASEPGLLELVLRGGGNPLSEKADFQKVAKDLPSQVSSLSYVNADDQARASYDMMKSGSFEKALQNAQPGAPDMSKLAKLFNKDKLPEFSVFAKYLEQSGGYGVMDDDGMVFTSFSLKPAKP
jgi:hypothetical protein